MLKMINFREKTKNHEIAFFDIFKRSNDIQMLEIWQIIDHRMIEKQFQISKSFSKSFKKSTFRKVEQYAFSISKSLQMTSFYTFQDTSECLGGPQDTLRQNG